MHRAHPTTRRPPAMLPGAAIAVAALWLAWTIIADTAADRLARADPDTALAWRSGHPDAMTALGERILLSNPAPADVERAAALAAGALRRAPLDTAALRLLALSAEVAGDLATTETLMDAASRRSRRDPLVQLWLFDRRAALGDYPAALAHADAALRVWPDLGERLLPTLAMFAGQAEARAPLVTALTQMPPWRGWFLTELARHDDAAFQVLNALKQQGSPPADSELAPYLSALIAQRRYEEAYLGWLHFLPAEQRQAIFYVRDGGFESSPNDLPFGWSITAIAGARTTIVPRDGGHALKVEFANRQVAYRHVRTLLMLPPGAFRLAGEFRAENLRNERGLVWRLTCAEDDRHVIAESPLVRGTAPWTGFEIGFDVPPDNCRAQWLTLVLAARTTLEQQAVGTAWFDNLRVERAGR